MSAQIQSPTAPARPAGFDFSVPNDQAAALASKVPFVALSAARKTLGMLKEVHAAPTITDACKRLAATTQGRGWSAETLRTKYYAYVRGTKDYPAGDWRIVLDKSKARLIKAPSAAVKERIPFLEFWRKLGESHHQDWAAAHDELLRIWRTTRDNQCRTHTAIPGYDKWPEPDAWQDQPTGWSYANLMRYQSDIYDQTAARIGHSAASAHRVPVLTTRVGLQFGQYFEFDDHEFNQRVLFQRKPMRPLGFGAIELSSACLCNIGLKPTLWDYEAGAKRKLTEREFMWFVTALLTQTGYRHDIGTTLIVERGTAAIRDDFARRLESISGGKLSTHVGGRHGMPAHNAQFAGRSKGNFRTKALIEGCWALVDNQTAALPAQTGRTRNDSPEEFAPQAGAEQYTARIFKAADAQRLTPEQLEQLKFPYPTWSAWLHWAMDAIHNINTDPNHSLEGWDKLGRVQPVWRLPSPIPGTPTQWLPWSAFTSLPAEQQAVIKHMLDADPALLKTIRLSRRQAFDSNRHLLKTVPWEILPELVGMENALNAAEPLTVKNGLIRFELAEIDPDPIEFYARDIHASAGNFLPNGTKITAFLNPYAPSHLVACDAQGRTLAVCPRYTRAVRSDQDAINALLGAQSAFEAAARTRLNLRHSDAAADRNHMLNHNQSILSQPARPENPSIKHYDRSTDDLLSPDNISTVATVSDDSDDTSSLL